MESSTFLLIDENGKDHAISQEILLFIGDVGSLAQAAHMTQEQSCTILLEIK
jgi:hypothetical protein